MTSLNSNTILLNNNISYDSGELENRKYFFGDNGSFKIIEGPNQKRFFELNYRSNRSKMPIMTHIVLIFNLNQLKLYIEQRMEN